MKALPKVGDQVIAKRGRNSGVVGVVSEIGKEKVGDDVMIYVKYFCEFGLYVYPQWMSDLETAQLGATR